MSTNKTAATKTSGRRNSFSYLIVLIIKSKHSRDLSNIVINHILKSYQEAIDTFQNLMKISNRHQQALTHLIWAYCTSGNFEEARVLMLELNERSVTEYISGIYAGISAAYLGEIDAAFDYLEKAYTDRDPQLAQIRYAPYVPPSLKNDSRFKNLLDRIGFP